MRPIPLHYLCYRASDPLRMDGRLDEGAWAAAPWTSDFVDIEGDKRPQPRFRTRAKMLWDDRYFYVAAELEEPHIWGTLTAHDSVIFQDPDFEIFIDPDGDNHQYYEWEVNALGTTWDLFLPKPYRDGGPAMNSWEIAGLRHAIHVDGTINDPSDQDRKWTVEVAIPWDVLGQAAHRHAPPKDGDQWRVNFSRVEWDITAEGGKYVKVPNRPEHNWVWSPQGVIDMHRPERWGFVQFCNGATGSGLFALDPAWPAREALVDVYYAQIEYRKKHGKWAAKLGDLAMTNLGDLRDLVRLETTTNLFEASIPVTYPDGTSQRWHIREDSRVWSDKGPEKDVHRW